MQRSKEKIAVRREVTYIGRSPSRPTLNPRSIPFRYASWRSPACLRNLDFPASWPPSVWSVRFYLIRGIIAAPAGDGRMKEVAAAIEEGAKAYLNRQVATIGVIAA